MQNNSNQTVDMLKNVLELSRDKALQERNLKVLNSFNKEDGYKQINETTTRFYMIINALSVLTGRIVVNRTVESMTEEELYWQLQYLTQNIPVYILAEKALEKGIQNLQK